MKRLISILILLFSTFLLYSAVDDEFILHIRAFKPGDSNVELKLNNALSLDDISAYDVVNLNEAASEIVGNMPTSDPSTMICPVVFSYRVEGADKPGAGNTIGYTLSIELTAFKLKSDNSDTSVYIPAYYQLGNLNATFPGNASDEENKNTSVRDDGWEIAYDSGIPAVQGNMATGNQSVVFNTSWTIKNERQNIESDMPRWITRGAVGVIVDYNTFNAAETPYGQYQATATITLGVNQ